MTALKKGKEVLEQKCIMTYKKNIMIWQGSYNFKTTIYYSQYGDSKMHIVKNKSKLFKKRNNSY